MPAVGFSIEDAKRIAATVRRVERTPQDMTHERAAGSPVEASCWGYLVSTDLSGNHWSWLKLVPAARLPNAEEPNAPLQSERPLFELAQPVFYSDHTAREANGNKAIEGGTVVQMTFIGYDSKREPVYCFATNATPPDFRGVPLHDHRDNVTGGRFAFSVYHPGTGLPQQPFFL